MGTRENKFQKCRELVQTQVNYIISFISLQHFAVFHMSFKTCFRLLELLDMMFSRRYLKHLHRRLLNDVNDSVQKFLPPRYSNFWRINS